MSLLIVILAGLGLLSVGYIFYGRFLSRFFKLDQNVCTPAVEINDGLDYVPARKGFLLGQHFSAIAAAGPIVGPILAGLWFGWLPAVLWIVLGTILIGGVHDFSALIASIRHKALSIGEIVRQHISQTAFLLFLIFVWLTLIYVIIAFTSITAETFKTVIADPARPEMINNYGTGVAASSVLYLILAVLMGLCLAKLRMPLWLASAIFIPLVLFIVWLGPHLPENILNIFNALSVKQWSIILLVYCFVAAVIPMWLLLQPRGYLGGCFLYGTIIAGLIGVLFGGFQINYPAFHLENLKSALSGKPLFPMLFITIACGAISGFHAIVSTGTTSKQIRCEPDACTVGYGGMVLEGVVALLALSTIMILVPTDPAVKTDPTLIYANGIAGYLGLLGLDFNLVFAFALLAFSTFVYDTLDVCTRLGRYVFQELVGLSAEARQAKAGWKGKASASAAALATLVIPLVFLLMTPKNAYLVAWPVFGTSNQLLASLTLLGISVWLWRTGKNPLVTLLPMIFIMIMTFWSLILLIKPGIEALFSEKTLSTQGMVVSITAGVLFILAVCLIVVTGRVVLNKFNHR